MPAAKHILIKYEDLHPQVRDAVRKVIEQRKARKSSAYTLSKNPVFYPLLAGALYAPSNYAKKLFSAVLVGDLASAQYAGYKSETKKVRELTDKLGRAIRANAIDKKANYRPSKLAETHPYYFVNRKGDLILLPKTKFQNAIAKAQGTFLREVLPARWRGKL